MAKTDEVALKSAVELLFDEISEGYGGTQRFNVSGKIFEIVIPGDADAHAQVYGHLQRFQSLTAKTMPQWADLLPVSAAVANRLAYARLVDVGIFADGATVKLTDHDLLRLAKKAGGIFIALTDEIMGRCQSTVTQAEIALTEELGNASPTTPGVG